MLAAYEAAPEPPGKHLPASPTRPRCIARNAAGASRLSACRVDRPASGCCPTGGASRSGPCTWRRMGVTRQGRAEQAVALRPRGDRNVVCPRSERNSKLPTTAPHITQQLHVPTRMRRYGSLRAPARLARASAPQTADCRTFIRQPCSAAGPARPSPPARKSAARRQAVEAPGSRSRLRTRLRAAAQGHPTRN